MQTKLPRIGITPGEPAGIGPDICLQTLREASRIAEPVYFASSEMLAARAELLGIDIEINELDTSNYDPAKLNVYPVTAASPVEPGQPAAENANYILATLRSALDQCLAGEIAAITTGPINKAIINEAGTPFSGHTEWFAEQTSTPRVVMMLLSGDFRVALATTHLPLSQVPNAITQAMLEETINILAKDLSTKFGITNPRISVCGLNPHAGESGHMGDEEIRIIAPVIERFRQQGLNLTGPLPADTAFTKKALENQDAVLAMYHDQGLPVLKHAAFGDAVNVTLGLPIIRTSVDHGTAFDLAGTGKADPGSFLAAIACAAELADKVTALER